MTSQKPGSDLLLILESLLERQEAPAAHPGDTGTNSSYSGEPLLWTQMQANAFMGRALPLVHHLKHPSLELASGRRCWDASGQAGNWVWLQPHPPAERLP